MNIIAVAETGFNRRSYYWCPYCLGPSSRPCTRAFSGGRLPVASESALANPHRAGDRCAVPSVIILSTRGRVAAPVSYVRRTIRGQATKLPKCVSFAASHRIATRACPCVHGSYTGPKHLRATVEQLGTDKSACDKPFRWPCHAQIAELPGRYKLPNVPSVQ